MDSKIFMMALVAAFVVFSGCAILMTEDSDALDNGTANMTVAQGGTSTYTWAQASSAMVATSSFDNQPF